MPDPVGASAASGQDFVPFLVERIRRGRCILLLGPGAAIDPAHLDGPPLGVAFARELAADEKVGGSGLVRPIDASNLRYVAEVFARQHDRDELERRAAAFFKAVAAATTDFHRNLARLPFSLCVNTCPDLMMANAFREVGKAPRTAHYNLRRQHADPPQGSEQAPLVYQLYGSVDEVQFLESLVLTESDLVDFLVTVVRNEPSLPAWMRALVGKKETEFLFLGFGFQNWHVRVLAHVLGVMEVHERPSYALEDQDFFAHPDSQQAVGYFARSGGGVKFQQLAWSDFSAQLRKAYESAGGKPAVAAPAGGPLAFLSYASEEEPAVTALAARLEARGISVWQDRQKLRGGDRWEQALRHVIGKDVNYFIPVQSVAMGREGVFNSEISWALDRQTRFPDGQRFVIPVTVDGRAIERLKDTFHMIDLRQDSGVDDLTKAILEDWQKRAPGA